MHTILTLGGTGLLGQPVVRHLQQEGFHVRVLSRDPDKARAAFEQSIDIVEGDVQDMDSLEHALEGCFGAHISVGGDVDQLSAENVSKLAPQLGVERISYISGSTVAQENSWFPMIQQKLMAEKAIRECGVPYTIFCPTWPMETLPRFVRDGKAALFGRQATPIHWFAADELGRMVAASFRTPDAANKRFYIHGPEGIPMKGALERYCRAIHPEIKSVSVMPLWLARLLGTLTRNDGLKFIAGFMGYFDKAGELGDPTEANNILGAPQVTLSEWMGITARQSR